MTSDKSTTTASLEETLRKVDASLLPSIENTVSSTTFSKEDMLDFLDVKSSLMASYMIDLTLYIRNKNSGKVDEKNIRRLTEMKVALDKMRGLDKKLRYQIEKLLNAATSASTFASAGDNFGPEDPLQFRANPELMEEKADGSSDDSFASDGDDMEEMGGKNGADEDDDLQAARKTVSLAKDKKKRGEAESENGLYQAPRLTAVPYTHDVEGRQKEKEKRSKRRLRATELAQTLRAEYGDTPEQEDMHGGSDYGKQRAAARRLAEREAEKTRAEEAGMVRLITSKKDKKEKKRILRMESSNLGAISDLSNLVREARDFGREDGSDGDGDFPDSAPVEDPGDRHHNGKRVRSRDTYSERSTKKRGKPGKAKNSLQAALYATGSEGKTKSKKSKR
ncbi:unnamed protein product [Cylindrotheca closterium]|uniref:Neuroguidin n=1 Tax=Cylindrotheca closterium TaxID=2856 RepID=A0AAD2FI90_9STRA|nr:unnamed protein product [Cylindrotheca closterium]